MPQGFTFISQFKKNGQKRHQSREEHWLTLGSFCFCFNPNYSSSLSVLSSHTVIKKKWLQSYWWVGPLWHRRNPHGAGPLFGLWSVFGKGQSAPAMTWFLLRKEILLSILFFLPLMIADRECFGHQWIFFFIIQLYLQFVCVHEGRRFHSAITAPNDHVELDNDQLWRWVGNNCGTPAFYRCASVFCNSPQKKEK